MFAMCYWSEILRRALGHFLVAPEKLSRLCINADHTFAQTLHILFAPAPLYDNSRRVTSRVATGDSRFPNERAGLLVKRHQRSLFAAWSYHHDVSINQRRFRIGPFTGLTAKLFTNVL